MKAKILIVDDEKSILASLKGALQDEGYGVNAAASAEEAEEEIQKETPDLVLLDIWMPGKDGLTFMEELKHSHPRLPVIIISGHGNIETAVRATKMGAFDFVEKPLSLERILVSIQNALDFHRLAEENILWRQKATGRWRITGRSPAILGLIEEIQRAAPSNATVLITGENGTGKELVARSIHQHSRRSSRPMVEVNCAAIPEELIESELFGHEKGAFTGAHEKRKGKFDMANEGTLFLDEIGDMSLKTQAKILRIIQEQTFERVGGSRIIKVDVRIIAATNKDLRKEIETGGFRQDLYYRLNVIPLHVPPLRERLDDIPLLLEDFFNQLSYESALGRKEITEDAVRLLQRYPWPGNVRELKNFVERLVIMTPNPVIDVRDLPKDFSALIQDAAPMAEAPSHHCNPYKIPTLKEARICFEREYIIGKLEECGWNVSLTASEIGVERSHLHRKMKALGIHEESQH